MYYWRDHGKGAMAGLSLNASCHRNLPAESEAIAGWILAVSLFEQRSSKIVRVREGPICMVVADIVFWYSETCKCCSFNRLYLIVENQSTMLKVAGSNPSRTFHSQS